MIIHLFAVLHAVVSMSCGLFEIADDLMLTLLTMLMVVVICLRKQVGAVFMTLSVILANIFGLAVGKSLPFLFNPFGLSHIIVSSFSTLLCTEILGWLTVWATKVYKARYSTSQAYDARGMRWLLAAFVFIIFLRMLLIMIGSKDSDISNFRIEIMIDYFCSCVAIVCVASYAIRSKEKQQKASEEASLASFRYIKLKQQVNPHFLFNTLNVLDYIIQERPREQASSYTHKLAEIYRYMIKNENEMTVRLSDELEFVDKYVALMKVRFAQGFDLCSRIPAESLNRSVIPCSIQLLIENATKHNSVSADSPLIVEIRVEENTLIVTNNVQPRISANDSTGFGLKYLTEQYKHKSDRPVVVEQTEEKFTVKLPLL